MIEPSCGLSGEGGLVLEEGMVEVNKSQEVTMVVQNHSNSPVYLAEGEVLGMLQQAELPMVASGEVGEGEEPEEDCESVNKVEPGRVAALLNALDVDPTVLKPYQATELKQLLADFADVFALGNSELGCNHLAHHGIDTGDHPPIRQPPRQVPFTLRRKVEELVDDMLKKGVIQPSKSPWASPVVLVAKKDGTTRFCIDYRKLNSATKMDVFPSQELMTPWINSPM